MRSRVLLLIGLSVLSSSAFAGPDVNGHYHGRYAQEAAERCAGIIEPFCLGYFIGMTEGLRVLGDATMKGRCPRPAANADEAISNIKVLMHAFNLTVKDRGPAEMATKPSARLFVDMFTTINPCVQPGQEALALSWKTQAIETGRDLVETCSFANRSPGAADLCHGTIAGVLEVVQIERATKGSNFAALPVCVPSEIDSTHLANVRKVIWNTGLIAGVVTDLSGAPLPNAKRYAAPRAFLDLKSPAFILEANNFVTPRCGRAPLAPAALASWLGAAKTSKIEQLKARLKTDPSLVDATDASGQTALHVAGSPAVVKLLLEEGADINARASDGATPLLAAVTRPDPAVAGALLDAKASFTVKDSQSRELLHRAAELNPSPAAVIEMLSQRISAFLSIHGFNQANVNPLMVVSARGDQRSADLLLALGTQFAAKDSSGLTVLDYAEKSGRPDFIAHMREMAALEGDPTAAIYKAVQSGNTDEVRRLLTLAPALALAQPSFRVQGNKFPLAYVALSATPEIFDLLVEAGAQLQFHPAPNGKTVLWEASAQGNAHAVEKIIARTGKAELERTDVDGFTPLLIAASNNRIDVVKVLVSAGANLSARNRAGLTALDLTYNPEVQAILRQMMAGTH